MSCHCENCEYRSALPGLREQVESWKRVADQLTSVKTEIVRELDAVVARERHCEAERDEAIERRDTRAKKLEEALREAPHAHGCRAGETTTTTHPDRGQADGRWTITEHEPLPCTCKHDAALAERAGGEEYLSRIYVASSWRNARQPAVVAALRGDGHEVYDFRHPAEDNDGFHWSEIDGGWKAWTMRKYREALGHPVALAGFKRDLDALKWADTVVMVQPCGRSAALELGYAVGAGKRTAVLLAEDQEPELMLKLADRLCLDEGELLAWCRSVALDPR